jgi:hypothetical protein
MAALNSEVTPQIVPYIFYHDVPAALVWPANAVGFVEMMHTGLWK